MSVSEYSLLRHTVGRVAALTLLFFATNAGLAVAQTENDELQGVFDGETLRDPTRPAGAVAPVAAGSVDNLLDAGATLEREYRVSFIRAGGGQPMAVVNGQAVRVGELVGEARVLAIGAGVVALEVNGERRAFSPWRGQTVRQPSGSERRATDTMNREQEIDN